MGLVAGGTHIVKPNMGVQVLGSEVWLHRPVGISIRCLPAELALRLLH